jgi:CBS domain-containing protein
MRVRELMTKDVATCGAADPCSAAVRLMWDCDCGAIPIVEPGGRLVGMITDRDICMAAWMQDCSPRAIPIGFVMSRDLSVCGPDDDLASAERLMRSKQIRRLPVVDAERRLIGLLSLADIVREARGRGSNRAIAEDLTATLADICEPRPEETSRPTL